MVLASLLVPIAVAAVVYLVQRLRLPAFLALMVTVVVYGIAADMTFMSVGKAFGLGFTAALEQAGLLVVAGALLGALVLREPLGSGTSALAGALGGLSVSATGALALLRPAGQDAPLRALGLALTLLAFSSLVAPAPLAVAASSVMKATNSATFMIGPLRPPSARVSAAALPAFRPLTPRRRPPAMRAATPPTLAPTRA